MLRPRDPTQLAPELVYDHHLHGGPPLWTSNVDYTGPVPLDVHIHEGIEVAVLLEGEYDMSFDSYHLVAKPGDLWLVGMWEPHAHGTRPALVRTVKIAVVILLPEFLGDERLGSIPWLSLFSVPPEERPRVTTPEMRETALAMGRELWRETAEKRSGWQTMVRLDLLRLLLTVSREWHRPDVPHADSTSLARIMPALSLGHSVPPRLVSVTDAAAACGYSRSRFDSIFLRATGLTFGRFLLRSRLAYVAQQLLRTDLSIAAIGQAAGFADSSHLHRSFLKHYGCTPTHYREHGQRMPTSAYDRHTLAGTPSEDKASGAKASRTRPSQAERPKRRSTRTKKR